MHTWYYRCCSLVVLHIKLLPNVIVFCCIIWQDKPPAAQSTLPPLQNATFSTQSKLPQLQLENRSTRAARQLQLENRNFVVQVSCTPESFLSADTGKLLVCMRNIPAMLLLALQQNYMARFMNVMHLSSLLCYMLS